MVKVQQHFHGRQLAFPFFHSKDIIGSQMTPIQCNAKITQSPNINMIKGKTRCVSILTRKKIIIKIDCVLRSVAVLDSVAAFVIGRQAGTLHERSVFTVSYTKQWTLTSKKRKKVSSTIDNYRTKNATIISTSWKWSRSPAIRNNGS